MPFLSTALKISLIIIAASHIAIASPVPELIDNGLSARQASGGSVNKATDGDSLLEGVEVLNIFSGMCWLKNLIAEAYLEMAIQTTPETVGKLTTGSR
jgi:hypothetical protein